MFLEGDFFAQSCANEFTFNMGIMMAAVWRLTGMVVVEVVVVLGLTHEANSSPNLQSRA
jgi:hypothetical protein